MDPDQAMVMWEHFTFGPIKILGKGRAPNMIQNWLSLNMGGGPKVLIRILMAPRNRIKAREQIFSYSVQILPPS